MKSKLEGYASFALLIGIAISLATLAFGSFVIEHGINDDRSELAPSGQGSGSGVLAETAFPPTSFQLAGEGVAWKLPASKANCTDSFARTCLALEVVTAEPCASVHVEFLAESQSGERLDTFYAAKNARTAPGTPQIISFSSSTKLRSDAQLSFSVLSMRCEEQGVDELTYANTFSSLNLNSEYCEGECSPLSPSLPQAWTTSDSGKFVFEPSTSRRQPVDAIKGYLVQCKDGTYSNAGGKQGACSWHGGVAR